MSAIRDPTHHPPVSHPSHSDPSSKLQPHPQSLVPRSHPPTQDTQGSEKTSRKVSFSDVVITSSRVEKLEPDTAAVQFYEEVTVEERSSSPVNDLANNIVVLPIDPNMDELTRDSALAATVLPVFEVKLGMLKQATVYHVEFVVPDALPPGDTELLRFIDDSPGHVSAPVNVGAKVELLASDLNDSGPGHRLRIHLSTTKQHRVNEFFTLRLVDKPTEAVHLVLHGLSLARGQGTPFLRLGIHRIGENSDYEDSDEFTEWPGFTEPIDDEENEGGSAPAAADQGDKQPSADEPST